MPSSKQQAEEGRRGSSPGRPTAREACQIEQRLLTAGWEVLQKSGPEKLSLDQVARRAQASKKTIYARWANKRAFLQDLLENRLDSQFDSLANASEPEGTEPEIHLARLAGEVFRILSSPEGRNVERLVDWLDVTAESEQAWLARKATFEHVVDSMTGLLEKSGCFTGIRAEKRFSLVHLWIDGIIGRMRTTPRPDPDELTQWSRMFSRYFSLLLAESREPMPKAEAEA